MPSTRLASRALTWRDTRSATIIAFILVTTASSRPVTRVRPRQLLAHAVQHLSVGLQVGVTDLAVQLDNLLQLGDGPAEFPLSTVDRRHVIAGHRLHGPVPDLPQDRQRLPEVLQRPLPLAQSAVHLADVVQRDCLPGPVPDL